MITVICIIITAAVLGWHFMKSCQNKETSQVAGNDWTENKDGQKQSEEDIKMSYLNNYNFRRALDFLESHEDEKAYEWFKKALEDDQDNAYAHQCIGRIFFSHDNNGEAMKAFRFAQKTMPESGLGLLYSDWAKLYHALGEEDKRLEYAKKAVEVDPECTEGYEELSEYYLDHDMLDESDAAMDIYIEVEPQSSYAYTVKGRNELVRKHYDQAIRLFDYAIKLDSSYIYAHTFKAEALVDMDRLGEACDSFIQANRICIERQEEDDELKTVKKQLCVNAYDLLCLKLQGVIAKEDHPVAWLYLLGTVCADTAHYDEGVRCYHKAYELEHNPKLLVSEAYCWQQMGNFDKAASLVTSVLKELPEDYDLLYRLMMQKADLGLLEEAVEIGRKLLEKRPDDVIVNYHIARFYQMQCQMQEAISFYTKVLTLTEGKIAWAFLYRGIIYDSLGDTLRALNDYKAIIDSEDMIGRETSLALAKTLYKDVQDPGISAIEMASELVMKERANLQSKNLDFFDLNESLIQYAAVLSRSGDMEGALLFFQEVLENGGNRFFYYQHCAELEPLQDQDSFIKMIKLYEQKRKESWADIGIFVSAEAGASSESESAQELEPGVVPFIREHGICKVPCTVNKLPLHFVFDTGASDVTISTVEATFMLKNGYLKDLDLGGKEYYMTASGEISEGTKVRLREVTFGGFKLENVKASVIKGQKAPLLLGQTVLQRLGRIEIDNEKKILKISHS